MTKQHKKERLKVFNRILTIAFALTVIMITLMSANITKAQVVQDGLVSYWSFDEAYIRGDTVKDVWGQNDGTIMGNPEIVEGKFGKALEFDGVDDCVSIGNISALSGGNVTITAWVYWEGGTGNYDPIVTQSDADWAGYYFYIYSAEAVKSLAFWLDDVEAITQTSFPEDEWHFVTAVHDDTNLEVYINGVLGGTQAKTGLGISKTGYIGFDDYTPAPEYFKGIIDEVGIYDRVLSEDEIVQNMSADGMAAISPTKRLAFTWGDIKVSR
jgi:hypothetical protein